MALALQSRGWILRAEIIWHKPNAIPESVKDRPARRNEHLFLLTRSPQYFFNLDPIREPYTGDRSMSRRMHRTANKPHTITTTWPPEHNATEPFNQPPGIDWDPTGPQHARHRPPRGTASGHDLNPAYHQITQQRLTELRLAQQRRSRAAPSRREQVNLT